MKHTPVAEISRVADLYPVTPKPPMTRVERLERWVEALDREPDRVLTSIEEIDWKPDAERRAMRTDHSALTVAFEDPVLRAEGLASDRLGDAMVFFRLSHTEAHYTLCSCIHGQSMKAGEAARRLRNIAPPLFDLRDISPRDLLPVWIAGTGLAGIMVVSALLHLLS